MHGTQVFRADRNGVGGLIMAKGFILVDMPKTCLDCRFCIEMHEGIEAYCALKNNSYNHDEFKEIDVSYTQEKPDWCPIRVLPERKKPIVFRLSPLIKEQYSEFDRGWNSCLNCLEETNVE